MEVQGCDLCLYNGAEGYSRQCDGLLYCQSCVMADLLGGTRFDRWYTQRRQVPTYVEITEFLCTEEAYRTSDKDEMFRKVSCICHRLSKEPNYFKALEERLRAGENRFIKEQAKKTMGTDEQMNYNDDLSAMGHDNHTYTDILRQSVADSKKKELTQYSCCYCGTRKKKLFFCSGCQDVRYCGEVCQRQDWGRHKRECKTK